MIIDVHMHSVQGIGKRVLKLFRKEFRRNGVSLGLVNSLGAKTWPQYPTAREVRNANDEARSLAENSRGMLRWLVYINPQNGNWRKEIDYCLAGGAVGIKLWVSLKDKHGRLKNTENVLDYAGQKKLPVLIHTFNRTDPGLPGEVNVAEFMELAERHPQTRLIAAHAGIHWPAEVFLFRPLANVWVDCGGGYPLKGQVEALVQKMGAERVLFGSDLFCRTQGSQLAKVILANLPAAQKNKILYQNAAALFGLLPLCHSRENGNPDPDFTDPGFPLKAGMTSGGDKRNNNISIHKLKCPVDATEDHFCFCGHWPFFKTDCPTPKALEIVLANAGIKRAYTADLGSIYRQDLSPANDSFLAAGRGLKRVKPLAVINPRVPDWKYVLDNISEKFAGIILFPHLHNWNLADQKYFPLFRRCRQNGIKIRINCRLGDDRFRHAGTASRPVSGEELLSLADSVEMPPVVFQGVFEGALDAFLKRHGNDNRFKFEISHLTDYPGALRRILKKHGAKNLVMGSEYPFRDTSGPLDEQKSISWKTKWMQTSICGRHWRWRPCRG